MLANEWAFNESASFDDDFSLTQWREAAPTVRLAHRLPQQPHPTQLIMKTKTTMTTCKYIYSFLEPFLEYFI